MKRSYALIATVVVLALLSSASEAIAQGTSPFQPSTAQGGASAQTALGTAFTYQGQLKKDGTLVNDTCDFAFTLWDAVSGGTQVGPSQPVVQTLAVSNGLFTAQIDFGADSFKGDARWLNISVRCPAGTGSYSSLAPRQPLTPAPYAMALPGLYTQQNTTSPNIIGGYSGNSVASGAYGATIGGGGGSGVLNQVTASYGAIGGGSRNQAGGFATVGGGQGNAASGQSATIGGGDSNVAGTSSYATVGGGWSNTASAWAATVGGGEHNLASGYGATVPGGYYNNATQSFALAAGYRAKANHEGSFVWGDYSTTADFASTAKNQFLIRASSGVGINTTSTTTNTLTVNGQIIGGGTGLPSGALEPFVARGSNAGISLDDRAGGANARWVLYPNLGSLQFWNGASRVTVNSSGNVGIGATSPDQKLVVTGGAVTRIAVDSSANGNAGVSLRQNGALRWAVATVGTDGDLTFYEDDASSNRLYIKGAGSQQGNVGIGTTSPNATVHISATNSALRIQSTATNVWPRTMYQTDAREWDTGVGGSAVTNNLNGKYYVFDATANQTRMVIDTSGRVGIGTDTPGARLHISSNSSFLLIQSASNNVTPRTEYQTDARQWFAGVGGSAVNNLNNKYYIYDATANQTRMVIDTGGNVGIGTPNPQAKLDVRSYGAPALHAEGTASGGVGVVAIGVGQALSAEATDTYGVGMVVKGGQLGRAADFQGNVRILDQAGTNVVLEMGQGLDYAEGFNVSANHQVVPGMVLIIDPEHPGQLAMSHQPYDTRVAGIVAGAQNLGSGVRLGVDQFDRNVALAGRVYCYVDATDAAVEPGDLLTTSALPGYAMKAMDYTRAQGAILGKAMQKLAKGDKGLILVLVTLQ